MVSYFVVAYAWAATAAAAEIFHLPSNAIGRLASPRGGEQQRQLASERKRLAGGRGFHIEISNEEVV